MAVCVKYQQKIRPGTDNGKGQIVKVNQTRHRDLGQSEVQVGPRNAEPVIPAP